jgi:hypothetical protein
MQPCRVAGGSEPPCRAPGLKPRGRGRTAAREAAALALIGVCLLGTACAASTVWKAELQSPDGHYTAIARTVQSGGPGTAWIVTAVFLKPTNGSQPPTEVLGLSCGGPVPRPFVLDNVANAGGTIGLTMKWLGPTRLEVTYDGGNGSLYFQAVKYYGVDITVRNLSAVRPG